jgi:hypothetical protein
MTDPITASAIATLAFQEFIKSGAGELAKKFTGEAIAMMEKLRELIWRRLTGKHPAADVALEQAKAGEQAGIDMIVYVRRLQLQGWKSESRSQDAGVSSGKLRLRIGANC